MLVGCEKQLFSHPLSFVYSSRMRVQSLCSFWFIMILFIRTLKLIEVETDLLKDQENVLVVCLWQFLSHGDNVKQIQEKSIGFIIK